jgi:CheY-like chemotaxis protein
MRSLLATKSNRGFGDLEAVSIPFVLVVEDDHDVLKMLGLTLRMGGLEVLTAASGREAVELYRQHGPAIGVVLMDVQMPDLDGPETLAALQQLNPNVRCCFMSGYTGKYSCEKLLAMGAMLVFPKPFDSLKELVRKLRDIASGGMRK